MQQRQAGLRVAFSSLQLPQYRQFAFALAIFNLVNQMFQVAVAWQIYELTGSPLQVGLTGLARAIPQISLSLAGGVIADRVDRLRLIIGSQAMIGFLILGLGVLTASDQTQVWHVYALTFAVAVVQALATPARTTLVPKLVPPDRLVNAIALNTTINQSMQIVGPSLGGVGIATAGLSWTYIVAGVLTLLSLLSLATIRGVPAPPPATVSAWTAMVEGLSFVRRNSVIIAFMAIDTAETLFGSYRALLPFIAANLGMGPEGFGFLSAAPGLGSVLGAVAIMSLGDMRYKGMFAVVGVLLYCVALVVLAVSPWFSVALVAAALLGLTNVIQVVPRNSAIMAMTPDRFRGRVEAFRTMIAGGAPSLGQATSGFVALLLGTPLALVVGAVTCAVTVVGVALVHKDLRDPELGAPREVVAPGAPPAASENNR